MHDREMTQVTREEEKDDLKLVKFSKEPHPTRDIWWIKTNSSSALGRTALNLFQEKIITIITVVRREEKREELEEMGYNNVLN